VIEDSKIMKEIHKLREAFYRETKGKSKEYILRRIKEESKKMEIELATIKPDPRLMVRRKYPIPVRSSMEDIYEIRARKGKYEKK
jgi:hypothetical protein